jgi:hypothetical protein
MKHPRITLDGAWDFLHVDDQGIAPISVRTITVPGPWQAQFHDLRTRAGTGIYGRKFDVASDWLAGGERIFLRFGAVFHNTRVWVNGKVAGANEGGFLPFSFDVTDLLRPGENEIKLRVESPTDDPNEFPDTPLAEIPFGKQSWYGPLSGVWQSVFLERRALEHVTRLRLTPELATGRIRARVVFSQPLRDGLEIEAAVLDRAGEGVASIVDTAAAGLAEAGLEIVVPEVRAWSPDDPYLYTMTIGLRRKGILLDNFEETFGFRTIETRGGRLWLNGRALYLRGALDQDYYPDGICTTPSVEFLEDQFRKAKELGLNCLRCHIKAPDPRYYEAADRIGILIWTELPNGGLSTERSRARKEATLRGIVDRDYNHPSIIIWTIINENWGVDLVYDSEHRAWLKSTYHWLKSRDPTRLVVDNSPLGPSFHVETDIADYHFYAAFPDSRNDWDTFVKELASRPDWLFSPDGDAVQKGDEPLLCSEFGNWGLPDPADLRSPEGREPWWFETGHDWGEGVMYPHGVEHRFSDWSLDRVFGSLHNFVEAAQWQQFRALKYEIEALRREEAIAGYVITEFTDCNWESNGLLDLRRNRRVFHDQFKTINTDRVIVPAWDRLSYWAGETVGFGLKVANGADEPIEDGTLTMGFGGERRIKLPLVSGSSVADLGRIEVAIPSDTPTALHRIVMRLTDRTGAALAENYIELAVHQRRTRPERIPLWSSSRDIRERLVALGYEIAGSMQEAQLLIETEHDAVIADHVRRGGRLLLLAGKEGSLNPFFPHWQNVRVQSREGTLWRGDWASSFAWLRRGRAFGHIPGGPLLDETFDRVLPRHVISGCNLLDFQGRVYAGLVVGWIHRPTALLVERAYGKGRLVATTFRLFRDEPGADPMATELLDAMVALAAGPARPTENLKPELEALGAG